MNIIIVFRGNYPNYGAGSKRITNFVKALKLENTDITVLPINVESGSLVATFFWAQLIPLITFWKLIRMNGNYNGVLIYGFGWVGTLMIIIASKLRKWAVALEINEKPYSISFGSRKDAILKYFYPMHHFFFKWLVLSSVDGFISISAALSEYINKYKRKDAIVCNIPILVDFDYYQSGTEMPDCQTPYIIHTAMPNEQKDGIINVFKAFSKIVSEEKIDLHFYLTYKRILSGAKNKIEEIISSGKLEMNVHFLDEIDESTLLAYQQYCSVVVINKNDCEQNRYNFSTKLGEYLALGKPIITTAIGEVSNYLKDRISCLYIDPTTSNAIADAIKELLGNATLSEEIGSNGKIIAKKEFDYKAHSKGLNSFFRDIRK